MLTTPSLCKANKRSPSGLNSRREPLLPESLSEIFKPFYRVENDRDRSSGGVGLGLAIARRAVELHQGRMTARNANPGLSVLIELPLLIG